MLPQIELRPVSREDVQRLYQWLQDPEVQDSWYGSDSTGEPVHVGYSPNRLLEASQEEWDQVFSTEERKVYAIYTSDEQHIGECQLVFETEVASGHLFILIGRKEFWFHHYGLSAMVQLLDEAFYSQKLHRVWMAVPEYNEPALHMCEHIGFVLEGRLRKRHFRSGQWYDSLSMGLLADEYTRRRAKLVPQGTGAQQRSQ